jgi:hypothetical protein
MHKINGCKLISLYTKYRTVQVHILFQANTKNVTHSKLPLFNLEYIGICAYIFLVNLSMTYLPGGGFAKQGDSNRRPLSVRPGSTTKGTPHVHKHTLDHRPNIYKDTKP